MTDKGRKLEPPLRLDMGFGEAMSRFVASKPNEVAESIERSKTKKPPGVSPGGPPSSGRKRKPNQRLGRASV